VEQMHFTVIPTIAISVVVRVQRANRRKGLVRHIFSLNIRLAQVEEGRTTVQCTQGMMTVHVHR
jgi:hypothetical protein